MLDEMSLHAARAAPALPATGGAVDREAAEEVAREFEAVFLSTMFEQMFAGVSTEPPFGGGHAEETWRSLMVEEYGKEVAARGGIGIADHIARELLSMQEMKGADNG